MEKEIERIKKLIEEGWGWSGTDENYIYPMCGGTHVYDPVAYHLIRFQAWCIGTFFKCLR